MTTMQRIQAQHLFPGDVIRWEQLGQDDRIYTVFRVEPEPDGRIGLTVEAVDGRSRHFIVDSSLLITRVY